MEAHHWMLLGLLLVIGYVLGAKFPIAAQRVGIA